jgi:hypothetical protein
VLVAIGVTVAVMSLMRSPGNNADIASKNSNGTSEIANAGGVANGNAQTPATDGQASDSKDVDGRKEPVKQSPDNRQTPDNRSRVNPALQKQLAANVKPAPQPKVTPEQLVREAEQKYVAAIAILSRDVNSRRTQIDPMVLARFDSALSDIDRTINETRKIVREHPNDPIALQYLLGAYSKKVDVLRDMASEGQ